MKHTNNKQQTNKQKYLPTTSPTTHHTKNTITQKQQQNQKE